jgi:hypothetical protein
VGKYQAIVAGVALVLTAVQNPDGITGTATGKGPAVALAKLRDRVAGQFAKGRPAGSRGADAAARGADSPAPAADGADTATAEPGHHLHNAPGQ